MYLTMFFLAALFNGTLIEWVMHYAMHHTNLLRCTWLGKMHLAHHVANAPQGWSKEFIDYLVLSLIFGWVGFPFGLQAGFGWLAGAVIYAGLAAYAHQLGHEKPELVFWMPGPHELHHEMSNCNYGLTTPIWDLVFGTYKHEVSMTPRKFSIMEMVKIRWW